MQSDYERAIELYEKIAGWSVKNNLMRYSVKEYLLKAGLCHLAFDIVGAEKALDRYRDLDPTFEGEREGVLLFELVETIKNKDPEAFSDQLFKYHQVSRMDQWKKEICQRIKNGIEKGEIEGEDEFA